MKRISKTCTCGLRFLLATHIFHRCKYLRLDSPLELIKHLEKMWFKNKHSSVSFHISLIVELVSASWDTFLCREVTFETWHNFRSRTLSLNKIWRTLINEQLGGGPPTLYSFHRGMVLKTPHHHHHTHTHTIIILGTCAHSGKPPLVQTILVLMASYNKKQNDDIGCT